MNFFAEFRAPENVGYYTHNKLFTKFGVQSMIHKGKNRLASKQNLQKYIVNLYQFVRFEASKILSPVYPSPNAPHSMLLLQGGCLPVISRAHNVTL